MKDNEFKVTTVVPTKEAREKQALWDATLKDLDHVVDGLGKQTDEGIKETQTAFLVNGFAVDGSCEGHVESDGGEILKRSPYISIGLVIEPERFVGEAEIKKEIGERLGVPVKDFWRSEELLLTFDEYVDEHKLSVNPEFVLCKARNEKQKEEMLKLIDRFYAERKGGEATIGSRLKVADYGNMSEFNVTFRMKSESSRDEKDRLGLEDALKLEQAEMQAFGQFLKQRFFYP